MIVNQEQVIKSATSELSGSITISGSSALLPLMEQTVEKFNEKNPKAEVGAQAVDLVQVLHKY